MPQLGHRRIGLSLVGLLALLSTLSIGLGVLVPSLTRERGIAVLTAERSNLRILAQLMAKYATDDPDGAVGPIHPLAASFGGGSFQYGGGPGSFDYHGWNTPFDPRTRQFNQYLYGRDRLQPTTLPGDRSVFRPFQCLGDDTGWQALEPYEPSIVGIPFFELCGTSFRINSLLYANETSAGILGRSLHRIPDPSNTLAFMEGRAWQTLFYNEVWGYFPPVELTGFHGTPGYFLVNYADGRSDFVDFGFGTFFPEDPYFNFGDETYGRLRGTWGRMDCFPEPPIRVYVDGGPLPRDGDSLVQPVLEKSR